MSENSTKARSHCNLTTFKIEHIWKIDHFSDKIVPDNIKEVESSMFSIPEHDLQFKLALSPKRETENGKFIGLYLCYYPGETVEGDVLITNAFTFVKNDGSFSDKSGYFHLFNKKNDSWGFNKFAELSHVLDPENNYLHENHQLVVRSKATVRYNRPQIPSLPAVKIDNKHMSNQKSLLDSGKFSDFSIIVGDTKIPVHKNILSSHSPVFEAMFNHDNTIEAQENEVNIPDVSLDTMKNFLQYLYTGVNPEKDNLTLKLLTLADKYQVDDLKTYCADYISSTLTIDNVTNAYQVADLHNVTTLKENCLDFLASNLHSVLLTDSWLEMCKTDSEQMIEICIAIGYVYRLKKNTSQDE